MYISLKLSALAVFVFYPSFISSQTSLYNLLNSIPFLHVGTVTNQDNYNYLSVSCGYLEPENVSAAQSSWGQGGGCPYLFSFNQVCIK